MDLLRVLAMPFQWGSLLFVGFSSLLLGFVLGTGNFVTALIALWAMLIILAWLTRYAFQMVDDIANGVREASAADAQMANPFGDPRCWVHPGLAAALVIFHFVYPQVPTLPILIAAALLFPVSVSAIAMSGRARDAFNPRALFEVIQGLGPWLIVLALTTVMWAALAVIATRLLDPGVLLVAILELLLLLTYACIGGAVFHRRIELGFVPRISPERLDEAAENSRAQQRQKLFDRVYETLRGHDAPRAIAELQQWLRGSEGHQMHEDLRALLATAKQWNEPRHTVQLLRALLPTLLELRQPALAQAAADACMAADARFAPAEEPVAIALVDYAMQTGRRRAAARLLENFLAARGNAATPGSRLSALREALASQPDPAR